MIPAIVSHRSTHTALALAIALGTATCSTPAAKPEETAREQHAGNQARTNQDTMLSHTQVTQAVQATGDLELASWVESPDSYVTRPVTMNELANHQLFRVMPESVSHPMSFLVAVHKESGRAAVTTSNPDAVASLLAGEPGLAQSAELPERVYQLIREESRRQKLLRGPDDLPESLRSQKLPIVPPEAIRNDKGWLVRLSVLDGAGMLQHWTVNLPSAGKASLEQKTVARGLEVDLGP
jgi:hypothetical protein